MSSCPRTNMYKPNLPQFFKIILDDSLHQRKLSIPRKFVRNYGHKLSKWIILKVPSGEIWKVDTVKLNGQIWLDKGWQEFVECYSIVIGSLLVFQFDETNSRFNVTILDSSCSEIDYPYRHSIINEAAAAEHQVPKVESVDIPVEVSPSRKRKQKSPSSSSRNHKKMKNVENLSNITEKGTNTEAKGENRSLHKQRLVNKIVMLKEKSKAIQRTSSGFQSEIPTFQITMCPSHVHPNKSELQIPASFVRKYMKRKDGDATFTVLDGKTWTINLKVGDVCKFELIDLHKTTFQVVISRSTTRAILASVSSNSKKSTDKRIRMMILQKNSSSNSQEAARKFTSSNPFFKVVIRSSHLNCSRVNLPVDFMKNLKQTTQNARLVLNGKMWYVKLLLYPNCSNGKGTLSAGWASFARENCLKEGDVCTFELINARELLIKVSVSMD